MPSLREAIATSDVEQIRGLIGNWPPPTIASEIEGLTQVEQAVAIRVLPRQTAATTFEYLSRRSQESLLKAMGQAEVADILNLSLIHI